MGKAIFHAQSSAKIFGGKAEDYLEIHEFIDSSRTAFGDHRHRALTHHTFFLTNVLPLKFGQLRTNSDNKEYSVLEVGEQHVREDFGGFIPSPSDFLGEIQPKKWMEAGKGTPPPSKLVKQKKQKPEVRVSRVNFQPFRGRIDR